MRHQVCFPGQDGKGLRTETYHSVAEGPSIYFAAYPYGAALNAQSVEYLRDYLTTWLENPSNVSNYENTSLPAVSVKVPSPGSDTMRAHWFALPEHTIGAAFEAVVKAIGLPDIRRPW